MRRAVTVVVRWLLMLACAGLLSAAGWAVAPALGLFVGACCCVALLVEVDAAGGG